MKNYEEFYEKLEEIILDNLSGFIDKNINTLTENENSYRSVAFNQFYKYPNNYFDLDFAINTLLKIRKRKNFIDFVGTKIYFDFNCNPEINYKQSTEYFKELYKVELEKKTLFLNEPEKMKLFWKLSRFSVFKDIILPNSEAERITKFKHVLIEVNNLCHYCFTLISHFYPEFRFNPKISTKQFKRFTKRLTDDVVLMICYDEKQYRSVLNGNQLKIPEIELAILVRKENASRDISAKNFLQFDLGKADNYFFTPPVSIPDKMLIDIMVIDISENFSESIDLIKRQKIDDSHTRLYHEVKIEEDIKLQFFYYLDLYSYFSKIYLDFIEECILKIEIPEQ